MHNRKEGLVSTQAVPPHTCKSVTSSQRLIPRHICCHSVAPAWSPLMSPPSQQSAFLQCLASLNVDTWGQVLLPILNKQGSARDVALTCNQLRDMCHGAVQHINLSTTLNPCEDICTLEEVVQGVPRHFGNCTSVQLLLHGESSYHATPYLLQALARLPQLEVIKLRAEGITHPLLMGTVLYSLRAQLPQTVRALSLDLQQSWLGAAHAWTELARLATLTKLTITFDRQVAIPFLSPDLLPLSNLQSLQDLSISTLSKTFLQPPLPAQVAGGMTSLTSLELSGCPVSSIRHIGSCEALKKLTMSYMAAAEGELGAPEWVAVGQLTNLVQLHLSNAEVRSASPECCAAISDLVRLQSFGAGLMSGDVVCALTACTGLTELVGCWRKGSGAEQGISLPSVTILKGIGGVPPFSAFPNLASVRQSSSLSAAVFADMARHCTGLRQFRVVSDAFAAPTLSPSETGFVRIAAMKDLASLKNLVQLDVVVQDSIELLALADAVSSLLPGFECLRIGSVSPLQSGAFLTLGKLQGLALLVLQLMGAAADNMVLEVHNFLSAVSGIKRVHLILSNMANVDMCLAAQAALQELGLSCPKYLSVQQFPVIS